MEEQCIRYDEAFSSRSSNPPREVNILAVHEYILIKATDAEEEIWLNRKTGARTPICFVGEAVINFWMLLGKLEQFEY